MEELNKSLDALKGVLNDEIKKVTKKADITPAELENMTKTLCLIEKIKMVEEGDGYWDENGQSGRSYHMNRMGGYSYGMPDPYYHDERYDGMSGRRMRSATTGRYVSGDNRSYRNYGMSGHSIKDRMIAKLEQMYDEATTDHERQVVDEWIDRLADNK